MNSVEYVPLAGNSTVNGSRVTVVGVGLITYETRLVFELIFFVVICGPISLVGICANITNMIVFVRQGFKDTMTISLFGLAFADFCCLLTLLWTSILFNPLFANSNVPFIAVDLMYLSGGWPHVCLSRVTSFVTAFITLERCLCIAQPLKVKTIITPMRTKIIIVAIFGGMFALFSPIYYANRLEWKFNAIMNRTVLTLSFAEYRAVIETIMFFGHSMALSAMAFFCVVICTIILVVKLNEKTKWRQTAAAQSASSQEVSLKDKKVIKMVTFISTVFIICFIPATIIFFIMAYNPEFNNGGQYENMFFVSWSMTCVLAATNSSVNIIIYFKMSSKFRVTFLQIFCRDRYGESLTE